MTMFQGLRNAFGKVTQWAKGNEELFTDSRLSKRIDDGVLADVLWDSRWSS